MSKWREIMSDNVNPAEYRDNCHVGELVGRQPGPAQSRGQLPA